MFFKGALGVLGCPVCVKGRVLVAHVRARQGGVVSCLVLRYSQADQAADAFQ